MLVQYMGKEEKYIGIFIWFDSIRSLQNEDLNSLLANTQLPRYAQVCFITHGSTENDTPLTKLSLSCH